MFSMLTADAAAQHGHEFSAPRPSPPSHRQSAPPRSPLDLFSSSVFQHRPQPTPLPARKSLSADGHRSATSLKKTIMFALPPEGGLLSRPGSIHSATTTSTDDRSPRRPSRPKTNYALAHPPPRGGPLYLRPRVLLQLLQSSANSRPKPAFEAVPSTTFAPRLKREFHRVFKHREKLGPDDVVIVRAGEYGTEDRGGAGEDGLEFRDVVGVVCVNAREERTEICMDDDTVWVATLMQNGGYEFVSTDSHGLQTKARWVPRPLNRRKSGSFSQIPENGTAAAAEGRKFNFSTIRPDRRRHPVIASMARSGIDVWDQYYMPSPVASETAGPSDAADEAESRPIVTDEALRKFILVSGIWVAFREKWSNVFRYERQGRDRENPTSSPICSSPTIGCVGRRSVSMTSLNGNMSRSSSPGAPDNERHHSLRSVSRILHRNTALAALNGEHGGPEPAYPSSAKMSSTTRSRRANSTGTAFMKRAHSNKRNPKRHSSGPRAMSELREREMGGVDGEEGDEEGRGFTLTGAARAGLPSIADSTPKNSSEYASSMTSSTDDQQTPRAPPRQQRKPHRASLQVQPTDHHSNASGSGRSDVTADRLTPRRGERQTTPTRSKSTKERRKPRASVSPTAEGGEYGDGLGISVAPEKEKDKKRMSMRFFLQKLTSKRGRE